MALFDRLPDLNSTKHPFFIIFFKHDLKVPVIFSYILFYYPSAGSPIETLLRLLLPLNNFVQLDLFNYTYLIYFIYIFLIGLHL